VRISALLASTGVFLLPHFHRLLLICVLAGGFGAGALAQQPAGSPAIEVLATPYLWLPWSSIGVRPSNTRIPRASTTIDPGGLITHLTWLPFMGAAELRYDQFGLLIDFIHAPAKAGISTANVLFSGGTRNPTLDTGTAVFLYRVAMARPVRRYRPRGPRLGI